MEITYATGAKVILQGPVTYEVDSNGGYLSVGKLTGKLETKTQDPRPKTEEADIHPSSFILHPFVIRTPTATVTDLGTEFGVEVDESGGTKSHVFRGAVGLQLATADGNSVGEPVILGENQSARVSLGTDRVPRMHRFTGKHETFVRQMPPRPARVLLYDTFDNPVDSKKCDDEWLSNSGQHDYGLNAYLSARQTGLWHPICYLRGGDYAKGPWFAQVAHVACPGKLNLLTDRGYAGWVLVNATFPRDIVVSAELDPVALHCLEWALVPKTVVGDLSSENWMALGVRGEGLEPDQKELPLAPNAGAVFRIRSNGDWDCFENGAHIAHGRVSPAHPYLVVMRVLGDQLEIAVNEAVLHLDSDGSVAAHTLHGRAAETRENFVSLGAGDNRAPAVTSGFDIHSADNLTITEARPGAFAAIVSPRPTPDTPPPGRKEPSHAPTVK